jgi:hypothetical protein
MHFIEKNALHNIRPVVEGGISKGIVPPTRSLI